MEDDGTITAIPEISFDDNMKKVHENYSSTDMIMDDDDDDDNNNNDSNESSYDVTIVQQMLQYCSDGNLTMVQELVQQYGTIYACQQYTETGVSPLMIASSCGHDPIVQYLLEYGSAPWNAIDRMGQCAGNYATNAEHWNIVNRLVDWGTRSELILGTMERSIRSALLMSSTSPNTDTIGSDNNNSPSSLVPLQYQSSTKPDYLRQRLIYTEDGQALIDNDSDAVMMEWERPLMNAHAQILMEQQQQQQTTTTVDGSTDTSLTVPQQEQQQQQSHYSERNRSVLNVGFGMGIIDTALQLYQPKLHIIIEAHPDVYQRMINDKWDTKPNVRLCFGTWQIIIPQLIREGIQIDSIFYDTYGEHSTDLEDFHQLMIQLLSKNDGRYSFFNGLAPDNIFFHGVTCNVIQIQLRQLGLIGEFIPCEIQVKDSVWEGIRRKYWHGRDTYYLPIFKWDTAATTTTTTTTATTAILEPSPIDEVITRQLHEQHTKRQQQQLSSLNITSPEKRQRMI